MREILLTGNVDGSLTLGNEFNIVAGEDVDIYIRVLGLETVAAEARVVLAFSRKLSAPGYGGSAQLPDVLTLKDTFDTWKLRWPSVKTHNLLPGRWIYTAFYEAGDGTRVCVIPPSPMNVAPGLIMRPVGL